MADSRKKFFSLFLFAASTWKEFLKRLEVFSSADRTIPKRSRNSSLEKSSVRDFAINRPRGVSGCCEFSLSLSSPNSKNVMIAFFRSSGSPFIAPPRRCNSLLRTSGEIDSLRSAPLSSSPDSLPFSCTLARSTIAVSSSG